jgi:hypothetical protein
MHSVLFGSKATAVETGAIRAAAAASATSLFMDILPS